MEDKVPECEFGIEVERYPFLGNYFLTIHSTRVRGAKITIPVIKEVAEKKLETLISTESAEKINCAFELILKCFQQ